MKRERERKRERETQRLRIKINKYWKIGIQIWSTIHISLAHRLHSLPLQPGRLAVSILCTLHNTIFHRAPILMKLISFGSIVVVGQAYHYYMRARAWGDIVLPSERTHRFACCIRYIYRSYRAAYISVIQIAHLISLMVSTGIDLAFRSIFGPNQPSKLTLIDPGLVEPIFQFPYIKLPRFPLTPSTSTCIRV